MAFSVKYHINHIFLNGPRLYGDTVLYQIGRAYCEAGASVARHSQRDFFEWTIVTEGRGAVITNGERIEVKDGDIYISFPGDFHAIESSNHSPLSYDFLSMQVNDAELHAAMEELTVKFGGAHERIIKSERIAAAVSNAIAEMNYDNRRFGGKMLHSLFEQIFILTIRKFNRITERYSATTDEQKLCYQLMNYIDTHIYTMKSLTEICEITGYNYNYLSNLFKKVSSKTLMEYYTKRRFEIADMLLSEGKNSITEIAELLNYSSVYAFSRAYKNRFGYSPSEYHAHKGGKEE
ncbi:MAG: AraC family transcriptional regulator [Clostridia bacterium]|nr:AraC family transcriptional regulator [Clostridia bacterium]